MENKLHEPTVSVRFTSYNHTKYIAHSLSSVLGQTFQDFDVEITDDCSTDNSVEIIESFKDPRIHLVVSDHNRGVAATATESLRRCSGKYTACICSDDVWMPEKLQKQVNFLEAHPEYDAVPTGVEIINDEGQIIEDPVFSHLFSTTNRGKEEWLRHFFFNGNSLCMPSVMFRTDSYRALNGQNPTLSGLSDFDLWIRFCMNHDLYILPEKLTHFRLHAGTANESGLSLGSQLRGLLEYQFIRRHLPEISDVQLFSQVFPEFQSYGKLTPDVIPYFLSRIALDSTNEQLQFFGYGILWEFMQSSANRVLLEKEYGFYTPDLHRYSKQIDPFQISRINTLTSENQHLAAQLSDREGQLEQAGGELGKMSSEVELLRKIRETTVWKLTKPFRKAYLAIKRFSNKSE